MQRLIWHRSERSQYCEIDSASDGSAHWMVVRSPRDCTREHAEICVRVELDLGFARAGAAHEVAEALRAEVRQEIAALAARLSAKHQLRTIDEVEQAARTAREVA